MAFTPVILDEDGDYDIVRNVLGISSSEVTDAIIGEDPHLPAAEAMVKGAITDYATLTGDDATFLRTGTVKLCAGFLCQRLLKLEGESFKVGAFEERADKVDWKGRAETLIREAAWALAHITTRTFTRMTAVAVAGPTRSGSRVPGADEIERWVERIIPRFVDWIEEGGEDDDWNSP